MGVRGEASASSCTVLDLKAEARSLRAGSWVPGNGDGDRPESFSSDICGSLELLDEVLEDVRKASAELLGTWPDDGRDDSGGPSTIRLADDAVRSSGSQLALFEEGLELGVGSLLAFAFL